MRGVWVAAGVFAVTALITLSATDGLSVIHLPSADLKNGLTMSAGGGLDGQRGGIVNPTVMWGYNAFHPGQPRPIGADEMSYAFKVEGRFAPATDSTIDQMESYRQITTEIGQVRHDFEVIDRASGERGICYSHGTGTAPYSDVCLSRDGKTQTFRIAGNDWLTAGLQANPAYVNAVFGPHVNANFTNRIYAESYVWSESFIHAAVKPLSALGAPADGAMLVCSDCQRESAPCVSGGNGALATRIGGGWTC